MEPLLAHLLLVELPKMGDDQVQIAACMPKVICPPTADGELTGSRSGKKFHECSRSEYQFLGNFLPLSIAFRLY
jgi:hypothetical protein